MFVPRSQHRCTKITVKSHKINPLHLKIGIHILHTVLCIFIKVLTRRICLTINSFFSRVIISFILVTLMCDLVVIL